jgi:hypothetical protein
MSRVLTPDSLVAVNLAKIEADLAASDEAARLATRAYNVAHEAHLMSGSSDDMEARVTRLNELSQAMGNACRQQSQDRYRLAVYRIGCRMGTREDYLCKRPR